MIPMRELLDSAKKRLEQAFPRETVYTEKSRKDFERPSCYLRLGTLSVESETPYLEFREQELIIATFVEADKWSDSDVSLLSTRADLILSAFQPVSFQVGKRFLEVGAKTVKYGMDFAEVCVKLSWSEAINPPTQVPAAEQYRIRPDRMEV